jgi:hypothetical protein
MSNKAKQLIFFLILIPVCLSAQECGFDISGQIIDEHTGASISFASFKLSFSRITVDP